jgi:hypothetical protein
MKKTLMFVCVLLLCNLTLLAQTAGSRRTVHTPEKSAIHVPAQEAAAGLKKIYSNLGSSKTDLYNGEEGVGIQGPNVQGVDGYYVFIGIPFTPKSNSHVTQVRAAVQYQGFGPTNQVNLSIYGDSGGAPGTLLAGPVTVADLPDAGTCCTLAVANFAPVAVTAEPCTGWLRIRPSPEPAATSWVCGSMFPRSFPWQSAILMGGSHPAPTIYPPAKCSARSHRPVHRFRFLNWRAA